MGRSKELELKRFRHPRDWGSLPFKTELQIEFFRSLLGYCLYWRTFYSRQ